ncbi:serine/threonine kinase [Fragilaria crotonensis]|nr:serine/threonine kinase [Fragilaria crotonensis]
MKVVPGRKLYEQACEGNLERVCNLLQRGVDANFKDDENGCSILSAASSSGVVDVVRALLDDYNVDVNSKDNHGQTAIMMASWNGHVEVVRALLAHPGVDASIQSHLGWSALIYASTFDKLEVVRALLDHEGVDVNARDEAGDTSLILASRNGHVDVVRALLKHNRVDVNLKNHKGKTAVDVAHDCEKHDVVRCLEEHMANEYGVMALDMAREKKEDDVARLLEDLMAYEQQRVEEEQMRRDEEEERNRRKYAELRQDMEEKRRRLELQTADPPRQNENSPSRDDAKIEQDRSKLLHVMNTSSANPVELSLEYIESCVEKHHKLGSGAFGDVFLAKDSQLQKKFAVKTIRLTHCDQEIIKEIRQIIETELSTLKTYRHPNIIALYGYSLNADRTQQCLLYEYAAYGSLADFVTDDGNRACLSAGVRLSIMFQLARAVHFLHNGGCKVAGKGWKVFHRDIKSANICLADDFTPRLIDCGLAEFVPDDNSNGSVALSSTGGPALGTPGYMCPEYLRKKGRGLPCPYIAAFDVYSIGIVLVELILGCLNARPSTRYGTQPLDLFAMYVQDDRTFQRIVDGWAMLKRDADPIIDWNPDALELVCKAAIQCMAPFPEERLSTKDLLDMLRDAILLNTHTGTQHSMAENAVDSDACCVICHNYRADIQCSEGHALCTACIVDKVGDDSGCQLSCLIKGCPSHPFRDNVLKRFIPDGTYKLYKEKRTGRKIWANVSSDSKRRSLV